MEILEVWIINESGMCLFDYAPVSNSDPQILGGFITAINHFGEIFSNESIRSLKLSEDILVFQKYPELKLLIIGRTHILSNEKDFLRILNHIYEKFKKKYSKDKILNWDGDISQFEDFSEDLKEIFKNKLIKTQDIW